VRKGSVCLVVAYLISNTSIFNRIIGKNLRALNKINIVQKLK